MKRETIKTILKIVISLVFFITSSVLLYKFLGENMFYYYVGAFTFGSLGYAYGKVHEDVKAILKDLRGE